MKESRWEPIFARARRAMDQMSSQDLVSIGISNKAQKHFLESLSNDVESLADRTPATKKIVCSPLLRANEAQNRRCGERVIALCGSDPEFSVSGVTSENRGASGLLSRRLTGAERLPQPGSKECPTRSSFSNAAPGGTPHLSNPQLKTS